MVISTLFKRCELPFSRSIALRMSNLGMSTIQYWQHKRLYIQRVIGISSFENWALLGVPPVAVSIESTACEEGPEPDTNEKSSKDKTLTELWKGESPASFYVRPAFLFCLFEDA